MNTTKSERQAQILSLINTTGFMTSIELAKKIDVTSMTIRRDIAELNKNNKLIKTYGGAKPLHTTLSTVFSTSQKIKLNIKLKKKIGQKLAKLVKPNSTVFLGAGTTLLYAIPYLVEKNLTFITNNFPASIQLANNQCRIISTGGELHKKTGEFLGQIAEKSLTGLNIDYALCPTNGINLNNVTTSSEDEGRLQNIVISHCAKSLVVADHTKLNHSDIITFQKLKDFSALVTDNEISDLDKTNYSKFTKII